MSAIPAALKFGHTVFDFAVHPTQDIVITGLINGQVACHQYGNDENKELWSERLFKKSCRGVAFTPDGSSLRAISKDKTINTIDMTTGQSMQCQQEAHENPLNAILCLNERLYATGDDEGVIKLWDARKEDPVFTYTEHEDYIADMTFSAEHKTLVVVGGDGYLSTWDIRKPNVAAMSDHMEDELLSLALIKNGRKAVVGSQEGVLSLWNWGDWGDYKDRMLGHPSSIDAICKLDEDTICTGSSDGMIRVVGLLPNKFLGMLGDCGEGMPVDHLHLSHDKRYLLSSAHSESIQFWDLTNLFEEQETSDDRPDDNTKDADAVTASQDKVTAAADEDDSDENDSDDSDHKNRASSNKRKKKEAGRPAKKAADTGSFFADL